MQKTVPKMRAEIMAPLKTTLAKKAVIMMPDRVTPKKAAPKTVAILTLVKAETTVETPKKAAQPNNFLIKSTTGQSQHSSVRLPF